MRGITDCWRISSPISRCRRIDSTKLVSGPVPQYWRTVKYTLIWSSPNSRVRDLVRVCPCLDGQPALKLTRFVERQGDRWLIVDHLGSRQLEKSFQPMPNAKCLAHDLIVIAFKIEVESEHDVERFAVQQADRQ